MKNIVNFNSLRQASSNISEERMLISSEDTLDLNNEDDLNQFLLNAESEGYDPESLEELLDNTRLS